MTMVGAGVLSGLGFADLVVTVGAAAGALLGAVGVVQLGFSLRAMLPD
jgi:CDP-diacylglycerol--glycerol-3-phosphate 3-phosphatidyltransferase